MKLEPGSKIAVVGASARAAAFSLLRAGYRVVAADLFADADLAKRCRATCITPYPTGFADWLTKIECDGWLYTGALENFPELVDRLAALRPLLGHSGAGLRRVRDPLELQTALSQAGFSFPETKPATDMHSRDETWLGKTYCGSCGSGVGVTDTAGYTQRHVVGTPLSAVFKGSQLLGVTRQLVGEVWAGAAEFKYCGTITPWPLPPEPLQQLRQLGELLNSEFELTELYGVDLLIDGKKLWTIEINPRYTAAVEVVERAYGLSVFGPTEVKPQTLCAGKVVLFAKAPILITEKTNQEFMQQADKIKWPAIADIPVTGTKISVGQPVLTLFETADTCEQVELKLRQRVTEIEQQIYT